MKKTISSIIVVTLVFILFACGSSSKNNSTKYAYLLTFPSYSMYYYFDTETNTATSFVYYKEDDLAVNVVSGEYSGTLSNNATVKVTYTDAETKWTETVKFDAKMSSINVSVGNDPTEATYMITDANKVVSILEKNG